MMSGVGRRTELRIGGGALGVGDWRCVEEAKIGEKGEDVMAIATIVLGRLAGEEVGAGGILEHGEVGEGGTSGANVREKEIEVGDLVVVDPERGEVRQRRQLHSARQRVVVEHERRQFVTKRINRINARQVIPRKIKSVVERKNEKKKVRDGD